MLSLGPFQKVQHEVIYFASCTKLEKMKIRRKLAKNCRIHGKNREISGPYNFWTPVKSNIPDVWNWNCWTLFGSEIEVWGHTLQVSRFVEYFSRYSLLSLLNQSDSRIILSALQNVFFWRIRGLCSFMIHDPTIHGTTIHDSCIN